MVRSPEVPCAGLLNLLQTLLTSHTAWSGARRGGRSALPPRAGQKAALQCGRGVDLSSNTWQEQNRLVLAFCDPSVGVFLKILGMKTLC